jgi:site-specific recombinase XerD
MPVIKMHQNMLSGLRAPDGQEKIEFVDQDTPGLYLEVRRASPGVGAFRYRQKINGRLCHFPIGRSEDMTLAEARRAVTILKADIAMGNHASSKSKSNSGLPTLDEFFENTYLPYIELRNRSWKDAVSRYNYRIKQRFGALRLNEISRMELETFLMSMKAEGLAGATADHFIKQIRHMLNYAVQLEIMEKNPAARIRLLKEDNKVTRFLSPDELKRLVGVITTRKNCVVSELVLFLLSTGARLGEGLGARFGQVDFHNRVWTIPASNSKSKRSRVVNLGTVAYDLLHRLHAARTQPVDRDEFVFRSYITGEPIRSVHKVWETICRESKLENLRIHDLRHTYASMLAQEGHTLLEIKEQLGHQDITTTMRYTHITQKSRVAASNSASRLIEAAMAD